MNYYKEQITERKSEQSMQDIDTLSMTQVNNSHLK